MNAVAPSDALLQSNACQISDWGRHKSNCAPPQDSGPTQNQPLPESVVGIVISCDADRDRGARIFTPTSIGPTHPIWTRGKTSPLFQQVGLPIIVYRHHPGNPLTMIPDAGLDNQIATYLMIEPSTGFASGG